MKRFRDAQQAFESYFNLIMTEGKQLTNGTRALFHESFTLVYPEANTIHTPWRKWSHEYAELEYQWYLTGNPNPDMVASKAKLWDFLRDENGEVNSNYGYWWKRNNQLDKCIDLLKTDPHTRRAVVVHYSVDEVQKYGKDTPCNLVLNFVYNGNTLDLVVFARSIDLVYGFCNDQYCFSRLLADVATKTEFIPGSIIFHITNLHIYKRHYDLNKK